MKVDGITLLQMIRDGEIKDNTKIYCDRFDENSGIYIIYEDKVLNIYDRHGRYEEENKFGVISSTNLLDYEFEIIEEDKPIEKLELPNKLLRHYNGNVEEEIMLNRARINMVIDYLKYKEEREENE